jgi:hypothetical protein
LTADAMSKIDMKKLDYFIDQVRKANQQDQENDLLMMSSFFDSSENIFSANKKINEEASKLK